MSLEAPDTCALNLIQFLTLQEQYTLEQLQNLSSPCSVFEVVIVTLFVHAHTHILQNMGEGQST